MIPHECMCLNKLQEENDAWTYINFPTKEPDDPLLGLVEEVGELAHAHLKQKQQIRGTWKQHQDAKIDAVGDIVVYLSDYCNQNNINLEDAIRETWEKVKQRDWNKHRSESKNSGN